MKKVSFFIDLLNNCSNMFSFFFSSRRRHTRSKRDWSSDVCSSDLIASDLGTRIDGLPKPKYKASFGQTLTQSIHFIQPGSTTIPYCFTSACTRTFDVHVAVQWPH